MTSDIPATPPVKPSARGRLVAVAAGLIAVVALSEVLLRLGMPQWREFHSGRFTTVIEVPGFGPLTTGRPGFKGYFSQNNGDFRAHVEINAFGLRNPEPVEAADGQVWTIGDSMTFGFGVEQEETYAERLQGLLGVGVYNIAGPGSDVCGYQVMAQRIPRGLRPRAVVVGLFLENDVRAYDCPAYFRTRGQNRPAPGGGPGLSLTEMKLLLTRSSALYNFTAVSLKRIDVVNEALIAVGLVKREHAERSHPPAERISEMAERTADEIERLRKHFAKSVPFAVLLIPARPELRDADAYYNGLRTAAGAALEARGLTAVDPFPALKAAGFRAVHFTHDGHWTPLGHRIAAVADALKKALAPE